LIQSSLLWVSCILSARNGSSNARQQHVQMKFSPCRTGTKRLKHHVEAKIPRINKWRLRRSRKSRQPTNKNNLCSLQELLSEILDVTKIACAPSSSIDAYRMLNSTARGRETGPQILS
jgi:hypothetical protein